MRHSLCQITNSSVSDPAWMQATLLLRFGGLGLRSALVSSSAAFLGSCNATRDLVQRLLEAGSSRNVSSLDSMKLCTTQSSFSQTPTLPGEIRERDRFSVQLKNHIGTDELGFFTSTQRHYSHSWMSFIFSRCKGRRIGKDYKHEQLVLKCGGLFYPLALESLGCWTQAIFRR